MTVLSRRVVVVAALALPAGMLLHRAPAFGQRLAPTPSCGDHGATPQQTEGPFFTPRTPLKRNFRADGRPGEPIELAGLVLGPDCRPVQGATVELWHADSSGAYDRQSYALRGHQVSDAQGGYGFETIVPGHYPGRTRHFHVKVAWPGVPVLTTQLYFPDEPANRRDGLFDPRLVITLSGSGAGRAGRFDFVVGG